MRRFLLTALVGVLAVGLLPPLAAALFGWGPDPSHLPPHGKTVSIEDGRSLHLKEVGDGTPVVLVHGLPSNAADWVDLPDRLAALGPYRVIAYDRVGYGYSSREEAADGGYTYASNARELAALLDALEIEQAVLVGWSYGGGVVMTLASEAPERVSHLVLVASVGPAMPDDPQDVADRILASPFAVPLFQWVGSIPPLSRAMTGATLRQAFARERDIPEGFVDYTRALLGLPGTLRAFSLEAQGQDVGSLKPEALHMPSLVIHGADDFLIPYDVAEDLHRRLPSSDFVTVLSGSHMLPVTHADLLAEKIHDLVGAY
ncbi:MAG: alpha/beta hydrolase [Proteobacteria bacterium]|nr:alpha/beta hydrolase [Pseudomonadota bacterium]